jgi:hypothetical protein
MGRLNCCFGPKLGAISRGAESTRLGVTGLGAELADAAAVVAS